MNSLCDHELMSKKLKKVNKNLFILQVLQDTTNDYEF